MDPITLGGIFKIGETLIDRFFPDPKEAAAKKAELFAMQQAGELKELETRMSAIIMEAQSKDPWTSRARPSFLYVMYVMILAAIPMGFMSVWFPAEAKAVATGLKEWLDSIPGSLWALFGTGYLGYVNKRSEDKARILGQDVAPGALSKILGKF